MKLSSNLSLSEVIKSQTAIRKGIDNTPTDEHLENLIYIANNLFQPLREAFDKPIFVSSGYRSKALNDAIKGSTTSQHSKGEALDLDNDVYAQGPTNMEIFNYIKDNLEFDQLIYEFEGDNGPAWVHVSLKKNGVNRGEVLKAYKVNKRTYYKHYGL